MYFLLHISWIYEVHVEGLAPTEIIALGTYTFLLRVYNNKNAAIQINN